MPGKAFAESAAVVIHDVLVKCAQQLKEHVASRLMVTGETGLIELVYATEIDIPSPKDILAMLVTENHPETTLPVE